MNSFIITSENGSNKMSGVEGARNCFKVVLYGGRASNILLLSTRLLLFSRHLATCFSALTSDEFLKENSLL